MRLRLILPLVIALGVAACESTPQDTGSSSGAGVDETISSGTDVTSTDVMIEEDTTVAALDPSQPLPGSQEELVQSVGDRAFFEFDSAVLSAEARRTLDRQAEWLRLFPEIALVLEGHADERGTREYNLALGERRANAVREYLITQGIAPSRLRRSRTVRSGLTRSATMKRRGRSTGAPSPSSTSSKNDARRSIRPAEGRCSP